MTDKPPVLVTAEDGVLTLTLNRPERKNALTASMIRSIIEQLELAAVDDTTRAVVIKAEGPDFCSGIDLVESNRPDRGSTSPGGRGRPRVGHLQRGFPLGAHRMIQAISSVQLPVVAGVRGWAAGVGNALALSADFTIAGSSAKFWVPFATKGFTPDSGNSWLVPHMVGIARAKEMLMRGRPIDGKTAEAWGLVSRCVDDEDLDSAVDEIAAELAQMPTVAVGLTKSLLHGNLETGFTAALQSEGIYEELAVRSDDFKEGMRAFAEKRDPKYTGW